jgi:type I restriction enzyme S subunit
MNIEAITGPLPSGWFLTTLGEVCKRGGGHIQTGPFGSQLHASDYVAAGVPTIMPVNIGDNRVLMDGISRVSEDDARRLSRHRAMVGDIIYSRRGDVERRALVRSGQEGWLCGTGCLKVRLGDGVVNPTFASYYLGHPSVRAWIVRHAIGATMPNLNTSIMEAVPFVLPPLPEQRAIANILGTLDDKLELSRRMNETLEAMARAIFKSWFVAFDPVRARAEGRKPPGLDPITAALFPDCIEDSPLGKIPKGWTVGKIADIASLSRSSINPGEFPQEVFQHYSIPAFDEGRIPQAETGESIKSNKFMVPAGCVLLSKLNPRFPRIWLPSPDGSRRAVCSTEFLVTLAKPGISAGFLYCLFSSEEFVTIFSTLVTGTSGSHQRVQPESLLGMDSLIPEVKIVKQFTDIIGAMLERCERNRQESRTLAALRDALLPKLLSGEIRVKDAEKLVL